MGYSYGFNPKTGRWNLSCDSCGTCDGTVRKRTCRFKVWDTTLRSLDGERDALHYCYPPAMCSRCYRERGYARGVHGEECERGAEASQARYDAEQERLDAGDLKVVSAQGDWHELVPEGFVGLVFGGKYWARDRDERYLLVPKTAYPNRGGWWSEFEALGQPWERGAAA